MQIIRLSVGDRVRLKKAHPCGGDVFLILRVGSDLRIQCESCGHNSTIDRIKFERAIKEFLPKDGE